MSPVNPRPRPYAERPSGPLPPKPANDNILGTWENGVFRFASPEAKDKWKRKSYEQGVSEETWHLGKEIDPESAALTQAGFGGANPGLYLGPDGKYRLMNPKTIESHDARDHRNQYLTGKTIDRAIAAGAMPGGDEWVAKGKPVQAAANDNAADAAAPTPVRSLDSSSVESNESPSTQPPLHTDQATGQMMAGRFGAMKPIADARIADKYDIEKPAGEWVRDVFFFNSLEDHQRWVRGFYRQGVGENTWHLGKVVDPKSINPGAANPGLYRAPDGTFRLMNTQTAESEAVRSHRDQYLAKGHAYQVAKTGALPGEDEWVEKWKAAWEEGRPGFGDRFGAAAKKATADGSISGNLVQQFRSGYARNPDTLATRPNDEFLQSGSHSMLEWNRAYEDLGIGGGKRLIDFLPAAEREKLETEWGKMSAEQQAAMRKMYEEKQRDYRPWREQFERDISVPPAETKAEKIADISGAIVAGVLSPDTLFMPGGLLAEIVSAARAGTISTVTSLKGMAAVADDLARGGGSSELAAVAKDSGIGVGSFIKEGKRYAYDPFGRLPKIDTRVLTNKQTYHLAGDETGLALVIETPTSNPDALAFENRLSGRIFDIETRKILSPSLLFKNPNGRHIARFDGIELGPDRSTVLLVDGKLRYPYFFNKGAMEDARKTLRRWNEALEQNPGYSIMVVFPNEEEMLAAQAAFKLEGVSDRIFARVIENE